MALEMKKECEKCHQALSADAEVYICVYECTFCRDCSASMDSVCPNCGGGFAPRPIRPAKQWRPGVCLEKRPASAQRVHLKWPREEVAAFVSRVRDVSPAER